MNPKRSKSFYDPDVWPLFLILIIAIILYVSAVIGITDRFNRGVDNYEKSIIFMHDKIESIKKDQSQNSFICNQETYMLLYTLKNYKLDENFHLSNTEKDFKNNVTNILKNIDLPNKRYSFDSKESFFDTSDIDLICSDINNEFEKIFKRIEYVINIYYYKQMITQNKKKCYFECLIHSC
jgi:hypothetical protein